MKETRKGMLLVISGPSGAGKGTLVARLREKDPSFCFSVSVADNSCSWRITSFAVRSYSLPRTTSYSCGAILP